MTPKEKAEQIVDKYKLILITSDTDAGEEILCTSISKQCALVAVNEILKSNPIVPLSYMLESEALDAAMDYWQEVKKEIENI